MKRTKTVLDFFYQNDTLLTSTTKHGDNMTPSQAKALKVGDLLIYRSGNTGDGCETLEIVIEEWQGSDDDGEVTVQTIAIIKQKQRYLKWANRYIGEKGFVQWNNFENFEKVK